MNKHEQKKTIFSSNPIPDGHSWTIVTNLGRILDTAEKKYGKRDKNFTILGVELNQTSYPQIWFPGDTNDIVIQLTSDCLYDMNRAVFQLSHEVIHCLNPVLGGKANYLEEGLAVHFSIEYTQTNGYGVWSSTNPEYIEAFELVSKVFSIEPNLILKLKELRENLFLVTKGDIMKINRDIPEDLAEKLTRPIEYSHSK